MPVAAKPPSKARRTTTTKRTRKATAKSVAPQTPVKSRPQKPNLSWNDYVADAKVRWEIHQWETKELWNDCKWGYNQLKPIVSKVVDYCKKSYNIAFNEGN